MKQICKYSKLMLIIFFILISSCKKFVEIPPPNNQLNTTVVFSDDATATAALTGIYGQMLRTAGLFGNYPNLTFNGGLYADELQNYTTDPLQIQFYNDNLSSSNTGSLSSYFWTLPYSFIYQANAVIEGLAASKNVSLAVKQQLTGEAEFIRAFCHFYLVNLFGDVPLVTTTDYTVNDVSIRTPMKLVYQQIIADLMKAQTLLNTNYVSTTNTPTDERVRPNQSTATALLARVYLYTADWAKAEVQATNVINNTAQYSLLTELNSVFLKNSNEAIWQFSAVGVSNIDTWDGNKFILTGAPAFVALSSNTLNAFESGDMRKTNWVNSKTVGTNTYYYPFKYKMRTDPNYSEYTMIFRLAEQYLIRAEARTQQNNISGAQGDLNTIRTRAGLANTIANDKASLLLATEHERQVELFTEWGHRFLDLKRTNRADAVLGVIKGSTWQSTDALWPIPLREIQNNPNLTQNPGY